MSFWGKVFGEIPIFRKPQIENHITTTDPLLNAGLGDVGGDLNIQVRSIFQDGLKNGHNVEHFDK